MRVVLVNGFAGSSGKAGREVVLTFFDRGGNIMGFV